jgi:hypothetical protein
MRNVLASRRAEQPPAAFIGKVCTVACIAAVICFPARATAQPTPTEEPWPRSVDAPDRAFEMGYSMSYTQGFGIVRAEELRSGDAEWRDGSGSVAGTGVGAGLDLGYRYNPWLRFGTTAQIQEFVAGDALGDDAGARGVVFGLEAAYHLAPLRRLDPWLAVAHGYRLLWASPSGPGNNVLTHGPQLARFKLGVDIRGRSLVAAAPFLGLELDYLLWNNPEGPRGDFEVSDPRPSVFVYVGVGVTVDIGGRRLPQRAHAAISR